APSWSAPSSAAREPNAAEYRRFTLDKVRGAAVGTLVSLDGWVGKYGAEGQILMFRDRTVAPPFVLIRLQDAGPGRVGKSLASQLARCQPACPVRVKGEVLPVAGEVPAIFAHAIDVIG